MCTDTGGSARHLCLAVQLLQTWLHCPGSSGEEGSRLAQFHTAACLHGLAVVDFRDFFRDYIFTYKWYDGGGGFVTKSCPILATP